MNDFLLWLGHGYAAYRAFQDAGGWFLDLTAPARNAYVEALMITGGKE